MRYWLLGPGHELRLWQESIEMNQRSAAAALKHPSGTKISMHYPHALDYLAYAYLQRAEDRKAKEVLENMRSLEGPFQKAARYYQKLVNQTTPDSERVRDGAYFVAARTAWISFHPSSGLPPPIAWITDGVR